MSHKFQRKMSVIAVTGNVILRRITPPGQGRLDLWRGSGRKFQKAITRISPHDKLSRNRSHRRQNCHCKKQVLKLHYKNLRLPTQSANTGYFVTVEENSNGNLGQSYIVIATVE
jgi:hypothetical protein